MTRPRSRLVKAAAAVATALAVLASGVALVALTERPSEAAPSVSLLSGFDPGDIISDDTMYRSSTMTAAGIQAFLEGKQPTCDVGATCLKSKTVDVPALPANLMCRAVSAAQDQPVAAVIATVATACGVNPQVILVMLQKEQTLVTGRRPYAGSGETVDLIYRKATGLGCPDTAACDPSKYGLFNQLYGVAYWLIRYTSPAGTTGPGWTPFNWFPVGKPVGVLYNPSAACGAQPITIRNKATASLYYYTPYQPNTAALNAGWGLGDTCSAYGNRNFYLYFTTWFGSTHASAPKPPPFPVTGSIGVLWAAQGGATGPLGNPTAKAAATTAGVGGTVQPFKGGRVYLSKYGTWSVSGAILTKYLAAGGPGGAVGWPRFPSGARTGSGGGTVQGFSKGTIYTSSHGTWAVLGALYTHFRVVGFESGPLGWPTADAATRTSRGGALVQPFTGGRLVGRGARVAAVSGASYTQWQRRGLQTGPLGWPAADAVAVTAHGATGAAQAFDLGTLYTHGTAAQVVAGDVLKNYSMHGGPRGVLGWPKGAGTTVTAHGGGTMQTFDAGAVYSSKAMGLHALIGPEVVLYTKRGGPAGALGWPGARRVSHAGIGGRATPLQLGRIYSSATGTHVVSGDVLKQYLAQGASAGRLGWPSKDATSVSGTVRQRFQHGTLTARR